MLSFVGAFLALFCAAVSAFTQRGSQLPYSLHRVFGRLPPGKSNKMPDAPLPEQSEHSTMQMSANIGTASLVGIFAIILVMSQTQQAQAEMLADPGKTLVELAKTQQEQGKTLVEQGKMLAELGKMQQAQAKTLAEQGKMLAEQGKTQQKPGKTQQEQDRLLIQLDSKFSQAQADVSSFSKVIIAVSTAVAATTYVLREAENAPEKKGRGDAT